MVSISDVTGILTLVSLVFGMCIALIQLRNFNKTRYTEMLYRLQQALSSETNVKSFTDLVFQQDFQNFREWLENYGPLKNPEAYVNLMTQLRTYNIYGLLIKEQLVDSDDFLRILDPVGIFIVWMRVEPVIKEWRKHFNHPTFLEGFEILYNEAKKRNPKMQVTLRFRTPEEINVEEESP